MSCRGYTLFAVGDQTTTPMWRVLMEDWYVISLDEGRRIFFCGGLVGRGAELRVVGMRLVMFLRLFTKHFPAGAEWAVTTKLQTQKLNSSENSSRVARFHFFLVLFSALLEWAGSICLFTFVSTAEPTPKYSNCGTKILSNYLGISYSFEIYLN